MEQASVRRFWEEQARSALDSVGLRPTARDENLQSLIESAIVENLNPTDRLIEIGCGDGLSTMAFAPNVSLAVGADYIPAFIERAGIEASMRGLGNAQFVQGDVLDLSHIREKFGLFDVAVSIRCLINVFPAENQAKAISQIAQCIRPGGFYIFSEGSLDAMDALDDARRAAGLPAMDRSPHNFLMAERWLEDALSVFFESVRTYQLGLYLYLSRVIQPALEAPRPPRHNHPLNKIAAEQQRIWSNRPSPFDELDYASVHVLKRRG